MKAADIPAELARFIEERRSQPFAWGANDCCLFAADWVARATGRDPAAHYRGTYSTGIGAQRIIDKAGGILELARELGLETTQIGLARRGDVIARDVGNGIGLGVCVGNAAAFVGRDGLEFLDLNGAACWRL
jgi:hypothetical protein